MPAFDETDSYPSSPPEFDLPNSVQEESLSGGSTGFETNANGNRWLPSGITPHPGGSSSPQLEIYTLPTIGREREVYLHESQERINPVVISDTADDRYRRSVGPPESPLPPASSWQLEMAFPEWPFASPAAQNETDDDAIPIGTLRPWSKCGWVPNEDEPEPELAEFFGQYQILALHRPPVPLEPHDIVEFPMYIDFGGQIALGHSHLQPALPAPSSVDTIQEYVPSDYEQEEHPSTLPAYTPGLLARLEAQMRWDALHRESPS